VPEQIFTPGPNLAPVIYEVPGTDEVTPLACQALYDGSGASGDFVPTLVFRSQAGHVISRVPTSTVVTAGDSAEVTWAPFLRSASSTAPPVSTGLPFGLLYANSSGATFGPIVPAASVNVTFPRFKTNAASVFTTPATDRITVTQDGIYTAYAFGNAQTTSGSASATDLHGALALRGDPGGGGNGQASYVKAPPDTNQVELYEVGHAWLGAFTDIYWNINNIAAARTYNIFADRSLLVVQVAPFAI
jgi:hypothetical protein